MDNIDKVFQLHEKYVSCITKADMLERLQYAVRMSIVAAWAALIFSLLATIPKGDHVIEWTICIVSSMSLITLYKQLNRLEEEKKDCMRRALDACEGSSWRFVSTNRIHEIRDRLRKT